VQEWLGDDDEPSQAMSLTDILGPQVPSMTQSMALIEERAYAASRYPDQKGKTQPIIVRDDMAIFSALKDRQDLGRLPFSLNLDLSSLAQER
jgi:hypothetical protein